ncbi:metallo-beta-lactamase superfamily protein [Tribonema minus]|uniref:Metallo-beta-lactamase superfamily protein n=1 Tax=Tribonema minus TaxID=303371 RepID=A0A835YQ06_9STRA|nr:metallo-beta-lactamase superfamily protein [Tribonema minus]
MICRQLFDRDSCSYTYLLACQDTRQAVIIDPVLSQHTRDLNLIEELELHLLRAIDTHVHEDRFSGIGAMREATLCDTSAPRAARAACTHPLEEGSRVAFGEHALEAWATPGHSAHCLTLVMDDRSAAFTGDALLVRNRGRTDVVSGGSADALQRSITTRLFTLPMSTAVYPAHDYVGFTASTIGEEKAHGAHAAPPDAAAAAAEARSGSVSPLFAPPPPPPKPLDVGTHLQHNLKCGLPKSVREDVDEAME